MQNHDQTYRRLRMGFLVLAALLVLPACRGMVSSKPPVHLNPNMDNLAYVRPQAQSDFFADGRGMRPQVEGTVAQGSLRDDVHLYTGVDPASLPGVACETQLDCEGIQACVAGVCRDYARDLPEGMELTTELLEHGRARYNIYCTPCHGEAGLERGGVVPAHASYRGGGWSIPSLHDERPRSYPIGALYEIVTDGFGTMPGYAPQVPVRDRWAIASYVRALQIAYELPLAEVPREIAAEQGWR